MQTLTPHSGNKETGASEPKLAPWMSLLLRFAGTFNVLAGLGMIFCYHEGFKLLGLPKPELVLPVQVVGALVLLFGVGYHMTASRPRENRSVLLLGWWSKCLGSVLGVYHVSQGRLPGYFLLILFFADIIYLWPFAVILRRIPRENGSQSRRGE
jgi:uncharacterized membrane protein HdeD (DUF308 family)